MSISIKKYVDITSGVGAGATVRERDLIGRIFTTNPRAPADGFVEVINAADARAYFGAGSEEAARADFYFGFISKNIVQAKKLQFARYADADSAPRIYGSRTTTPLSVLNTVTAGTLAITLGDNSVVITGIDLSAAVSYAAVATTLQTRIRTGAGTQFANAVVTYDAVRRTFDLVGSVAETAPVAVSPAGLALQIGWGPSAVMSPGVDAATPVEAFERSAEQSNNFGSFLFMPELTEGQVIELAEANAARNVEFVYTVRVDDTNRTALGAALLTVAGVTLTYAPTDGQFDEMVPMMIMAATDYSKRNSVQNYMFYQFGGLTAKVTTTALSDELDALRINYYGNTQTAGQQINFYQRGVMGGTATAPVDQNVYANELWLKDAAAANIMALLLSVTRVPANLDGVGQVLGILSGVIERALFNGVISVGKTLTPLQKLYITQQTGDELAFHQVQNIGYWIFCNMEQETTTDGRAEYKAVYTLIYSKDDVVRKVEGTHVLI